MIQWILSEREQGYEANYAHQREAEFRLHARRDRLFGLWAAQELGYTQEAAEAYATALVTADVHPAAADTILTRVERDLAAKLGEAEIRRRFAECEVEARRALLAADQVLS